MGGMNRNQMMQQARKMQEQLVAAQQKAAETEVSASAGGGVVKVTATGAMRLTKVQIDANTLGLDPEDAEMLEDMILAAVNEALNAGEEVNNQLMSEATGSLNIPGL